MELGLEVLNDPEGGGPRSYSFTDGPVRCGRSTKNHIIFGDRTVSRTQVRFETVPAGWSATHEGSLTPTLVNGRPLPKGIASPLFDGDVIQVEGFRARISIREVDGSESREPETLYAEPATLYPSSEAPAWGGPASVPADTEIPCLEPEPISLPPPAPAPRARPTPGPSGRAIPTLLGSVPRVGPVQFELTDTDRPYTVGRSSGCDLTLEANSVSRRHAQFRFDGVNVYVRDAGARNPIKVNGVPTLGEVPLVDGDTVTVGTIELVLQTGTGAVAALEAPIAAPLPPEPAPSWESPPPAPSAPPPPVAPVAAAPQWENEPPVIETGAGAPEWGSAYDARNAAEELAAGGSGSGGLPAPPPRPAFGSAPPAGAGAPQPPPPPPPKFAAPPLAGPPGTPALPAAPRNPLPQRPAMPVVPVVPASPAMPAAPRLPAVPAVPVGLPNLPPPQQPAPAEPPAPAAAAPTSAMDYRPVKRPARRGKGWLIAGVVSMGVALTVGLLLLL